MVVSGQIDELATRERNGRRQSGALGADGILCDLHHEGLAFVKDRLDGRGLLALAMRLRNVGHVKEGRSFEPHVHEGALHAGQHTDDLAEINIPHEAARTVALDEEILKNAIHYNGDTHFTGRAVDENMFHDGGSLPACDVALKIDCSTL